MTYHNLAILRQTELKGLLERLDYYPHSLRGQREPAKRVIQGMLRCPTGRTDIASSLRRWSAIFLPKG